MAGMAVYISSLFVLFARINGLPGNNVWKPLSLTEIDNDHVLRNDHSIKITQPISVILVSFFSGDNVLSDEIKICYIFEY